MKSCAKCGQTFLDHVEFCFYDGEVLVAADAAVDGLDAPSPPRRAQANQGSFPAKSATPVPRAQRRSLLGRNQQAASYGAPADPAGDPLDDPLAEAPTDEVAEPDELQEPTTTDEILGRSASPEPPPDSEEGSTPYVHEADTVPSTPPPASSSPTLSQDPTVPPAPERTAAQQGQGGQPPADGAGLSHAETPLRDPQRTTTPTPVESSNTTPPSPAPASNRTPAPAQTYQAAGASAAAGPEFDDGDDQGNNNTLLVYGALAMVGAMALALLSAGLVVTISGNPFGGDSEQASPSPELPKPPPPAPAPPPAPTPTPASIDEVGAVEFRSNTPGELFVDGQARGTTPMTLELSYGDHEYEIRAEGRVPVQGTLTVAERKMRAPMARLKVAEAPVPGPEPAAAPEPAPVQPAPAPAQPAPAPAQPAPAPAQPAPAPTAPTPQPATTPEPEATDDPGATDEPAETPPPPSGTTGTIWVLSSTHTGALVRFRGESKAMPAVFDAVPSGTHTFEVQTADGSWEPYTQNVEIKEQANRTLVRLD